MNRTIKIGKDITIMAFLASRFVTPAEIITGMRNPVFPNTSVGRILFNTRYNAGKAIEGYDFV